MEAEKWIVMGTQDANFVLSPLSLHVVLAMIASGSNASTRDELLKFLNSNSTQESSQIARFVLADAEALGGPRLSFANGVWVDQRFNLKPSFKQILNSDYMAVSASVDFQNKADEVLKEVNAWAANKTNGLIKDILPPRSVDDLTTLILANAVYFKGAWSEKFDASMTKNDDFFLLNGSSVKAPFMTIWDTQSGIPPPPSVTTMQKQYVRAFDGFKVLGLPYKRGKDTKRIYSFSMYMFLPDARDGLPSLIEKISSTSGFIKQHLPYERVRVNKFRIPKFKISFDFEASKVLKAMGVVLPFREGGLSEMVDDSSVSKDLCVSSIFHKSFVEVNEEGTEAAAVSAAILPPGSGLRLRYVQPLDFVADHPFLFVIRENITGVILFIGQLLNPLAG